MDLESRTWRRDVKYKKSDGTEEHFKEGEPVGQLLRGWTAALAQMSSGERAEVLQDIGIWGQPRAWTDELISTWMFDFIETEYGQAVAFGDCLANQCRCHELSPRTRHPRAPRSRPSFATRVSSAE